MPRSTGWPTRCRSRTTSPSWRWSAAPPTARRRTWCPAWRPARWTRGSCLTSPLSDLADQVPVADHVTELALVCCPPDGAAQNVVPSVAPSAVYPGQLPDVASVPFAVLDPWVVISRRRYGGVTMNADPPPVPGVIVNVVELVYRACISALTLFWSVMDATSGAHDLHFSVGEVHHRAADGAPVRAYGLRGRAEARLAGVIGRLAGFRAHHRLAVVVVDGAAPAPGQRVRVHPRRYVFHRKALLALAHHGYVSPSMSWLR